jgi:hypothetical protein
LAPPDPEYAWPTQQDLDTHEQHVAPEHQPTPVVESLENVGTTEQVETAPDDYEQKVESYVNDAFIAGFHWLRSKDGGFGHSAKNEKGFLKVREKFPELEDFTGEYVNKSFIECGIYETCTITRMNGMEHSKHPGQPLAAVAYEASGPGFTDGAYLNHHDWKPGVSPGRDGSFMSVKYILPIDKANQLLKDTQNDPRILRDMSERYMKEYVLSDEDKAPGGDWELYARPPWEK